MRPRRRQVQQYPPRSATRARARSICPFRAKAVCEVQGRATSGASSSKKLCHNHEARVGASVPGQENTRRPPRSIRSTTNKLDRVQHDLVQGLQKIEVSLSQRLENIEKRPENLEAIQRPLPSLMGGGGPPNMGAPSMPPAGDGRPVPRQQRSSQRRASPPAQ